MRRRKFWGFKLKSPIKLACIVISVAFTIIQIISAFHLINISPSTNSSPKSNISSNNFSRGVKIGKFGKVMIGMLPEDLVFTLFLPSEEAIQRDLRLNQNSNDSYAILTRILGFSAVPRWISSADLNYEKPKVYDSISGFNLYLWKDSNEMVVINGVAAKKVDMKIGKILVHIVDEVVMDAEFAQSVRPEDDDDR